MKKIIIIFAILIVSSFTISCESKTYQDLAVKVATPTYTANIAPVMADKCIGCHSAGATSPALDTYVDLKLACQTSVVGNGTVLCRIDGSCGSTMPPSGGALPDATITMIKTWVANGYPEN